MASKKTRSVSRSEQRRHTKRVTLITALALLVVALTIPFWNRPLARFTAARLTASSRHFRVEQVVVLGNHAVAVDSIRQLAAVPQGAALLHVPVRHVQARLEGHPWIREAAVRRRLPNTVEIRVTEREPVAAVRGGGLLMLTADSMVVAPLTANWQWDLPILTPPRALKLKAGAAVTDSATLALLHELLVLRSVSQEAWQNLSEMYYAGGQIRAALSQPPVELVAGRGASELAWAAALKLLADPAVTASDCVELVDLRFPGKIVVTANSPSAEGQVSG